MRRGFSHFVPDEHTAESGHVLWTHVTWHVPQSSAADCRVHGAHAATCADEHIGTRINKCLNTAAREESPLVLMADDLLRFEA